MSTPAHTDIVPAMSPGVPAQPHLRTADVPALSLVKGEDIGDVPGHPGDDTADTAERPGTFDNGVPGHPAEHTADTAGHPGTFDNGVPGHPADTAQDIPGHPGAFDNGVPGHPADRTEDIPADVPDDTADTGNVPDIPPDIPAGVPEISLRGLSKAAAVRHIWQTISTPTRPASWAQVAAWLEAHDVDIDASYARRIVRAELDALPAASRPAAPARRIDTVIDTDDVGQDHADDPGADDVGQDHDIDTPIDAPSAPAGPVVVPDDASAATVALAAAVRDAQARLPLQDHTALFTALSDEEIAAEREAAEFVRAAQRKIRRSQAATELAAAQREQATAEAIAKSEAGDARWFQKAVSARRRLTSPDAKLARLHRRAEWSSRALVGVVVLGMIWSGINVQRNLVPSGDTSDPLYWISFGIEAMVSVPLIVIMLADTTTADWGRNLPRGKVVLIELGLLALTVSLNVGPRLSDSSHAKALEFAIAPVMVGFVIWLHAWVSGRYATLIRDTDDTADTTTQEQTR